VVIGRKAHQHEIKLGTEGETLVQVLIGLRLGEIGMMRGTNQAHQRQVVS